MSRGNLQKEVVEKRDHDEEHHHHHYHGVDSAEKHIKVDDALNLFLRKISPVSSEVVRLEDAQSRILYGEIKPRRNVPSLPRSTRDGFALKLKRGESRYSIVGDVRIGVAPKITLMEGEAVQIATGSFLPNGADAVVMKEYTTVEKLGDTPVVIINRPARKFENILRPGEDMIRGKVLLERGIVIRAQYVALASMLGVKHVRVFKRPRIAYFSTGDELIDPQKNRKEKEDGDSKYGIYDANRPFIRSMLSELGAEPCDLGILRDDYEEIRERMFFGLRGFDGLILSAGSSVGERDYVLKAAESIRDVRILVHGVAMRPSSPTGLAVYMRRKPFILLPGFPTSAIVSFFAFAVPAIAKLSGRRSTNKVYPIINVRLADGYPGKRGVKHYVRVKVSRTNGEYVARIVRPTEAYYSRWLAEANAIAIVDEDSSPVREGDRVPALLIGEAG